MPRRKASTISRTQSAHKGSKAAADKRNIEKELGNVATSSESGGGGGGTTTTPPVTSAVKRKSLLEKESENEIDRHRCIVWENTFEDITNVLICKVCYSDNIIVKLSSNHQLDTYVTVLCDQCSVIYKQEPDVKKKLFHPVTLLVVWCFLILGDGYAGVEKFISTLSLRHFTFPTYHRYAKYITECTIGKAKDVLDKSRDAVSKILDKSPGETVETDVSFDGSWHKRGHKSNFGIGAVIDIDTGLVLDYHVASKICSVCSAKETSFVQKKITQGDYVDWLSNHCNSEECDANYEGSSGAMESACALELWGRSEKHHFRYKTFVSDGDSSAFNAVRDINKENGPYGADNKIEKADCVNHVAKRLGSGLRNVNKMKATLRRDGDEDEPPKKKNTASMGGRNKLTDVVIDHLQYYFQVSMNRKLGTSPNEMRNEILSSYYHCSATDKNPSHQLCTQGTESWCFYNRAIALGEVPPSHMKMNVFFRDLTPRQMEAVKSVYIRLTTDEMMTRCMRGLTQNRNESLLARIWQICPKHKSFSKMQVDFATATAVTTYNAGYETANLCPILGITTTSSFLKYLKKRDQLMNTPIKRKARRTSMRKELENYAAGAF